MSAQFISAPRKAKAADLKDGTCHRIHRCDHSAETANIPADEMLDKTTEQGRVSARPRAIPPPLTPQLDRERDYQLVWEVFADQNTLA